MQSIASIHTQLGLTPENGLFILDESASCPVKEIQRLVDDKDFVPHSVFCISEKPFILFYESPNNLDGLFRAIWNLNEVPVVIISDESTVSIYNGFNFLKERFSLAPIGNEERLGDFSYLRLVSGSTWEMLTEELAEKNRVDYKLLENIKEVRRILVAKGLAGNIANSLIGKVIFSRYLIDRKVQLSFKRKKMERTNADLCDILRNLSDTDAFFRYLDKTFNGELFRFSYGRHIRRRHLDVIVHMLQGMDFSTGQLSLFDVFDFSIIPIEFISNVYELFIGQEVQSEKGAYYTPLFLVRYIMSQTVQPFLDKPRRTISCKVLDPACGSGIFLVETLRLLIDKYNQSHPNASRSTKHYRETVKSLAKANLFGMDKDDAAINVAVFSIYITLLDYQRPRDLTQFKFPKLIGSNFFHDDAFDRHSKAQRKLISKSFDFVLGNPPWKRGAARANTGNQCLEDYIKQLRASGGREAAAVISNKEIAQAFLLRAGDFATPATRIALIVTSKVLYNLQAKAFRQSFLTRFTLHTVFELAAVRREVFDKSNDSAIAPAAVLFYSRTRPQEQSVFVHIALKPSRLFTLFKVFMLHRADMKRVRQTMLLDHDWLWKVLLYGSYRDFHLLLRLKDSYPTIEQAIKNRKAVKGQGVQINGTDDDPALATHNDASHLVGKPYLDSRRDIDPYYPHPSGIWNHAIVHRARDRNLFTGPALLVTKGIAPTSFRATAAVTEAESIVFTDSITGIRSDDVNFLYTVCGYLNSSLFAYLSLISFSSIGVEREQVHVEEKFAVPYTDSDEACSLARQLHEVSARSSLAPRDLFNQDFGETELQQMNAKLDEAVLKALTLSADERVLVDYHLTITIPTITRRQDSHGFDKPVPLQSHILDNYIKCYVVRFGDYLTDSKKCMSVEIIHTNEVLGMFFTFRDTELPNISSSITWHSVDYATLLNRIIALGQTKISDRLFVQKDIRGFEENGFYIFKPNQYQLWHPAIGLSDTDDFFDAILRSGMRSS